VTEPDLADRLRRLEDLAAIQQLPIRYALAVDGRDLDAWTGLFVPDVDCGRHGRGRPALRHVIAPQLRSFYRSVHLICGHEVDLIDHATARGRVYCRAEHEDGDQWVVMAICYFDDYAKVDGAWLFRQRVERHWYAADQREAPMQVGRQPWPPGIGRAPALPAAFASWAPFWADTDPQRLAQLTRQQVPA